MESHSKEDPASTAASSSFILYRQPQPSHESRSNYEGEVDYEMQEGSEEEEEEGDYEEDEWRGRMRGIVMFFSDNDIQSFTDAVYE